MYPYLHGGTAIYLLTAVAVVLNHHAVLCAQRDLLGGGGVGARHRNFHAFRLGIIYDV